MVNMILFQIVLLAVIRLNVNAAMHIVILYGVIMQMKLLRYGTGEPINEKELERAID